MVDAEEISQFDNISAENGEGVTEVESLCVACEENGTTKFLFVKIPFYKEVIISSFSCPHCGYSNNEIQSAGQIQEKGFEVEFTITSTEDMNRQIVKTDSATFKIPELNFEIPAFTQKGCLSTLEGVMQRSIDGLLQEQPVRKVMDPKNAEKIEEFVGKMKKLMCVERPFSVIIHDPSGNSFIENPNAPKDDPNLKFRFYLRTLEQNKSLGLAADDAVAEERPEIQLPERTETLDLENEVVTFENNCTVCNVMCTTNMKAVKIPHFKEVIVMATTCDKCGHRTNEVKSGGGFEPKGKRVTLRFTCPEDLTRDVLKSETCSIIIPELDMETGAAALSGKFTTVEGMLQDLKKMLIESNPFVGGDSSKSEKLAKVGEILDLYSTGTEKFVLILDDPNSNSYIQSFYAPEPDPFLTEEVYERTFEQNEELGLNDMKTENY